MKYLFTFVLLISALIFPTQSLALSCVELPPMEESFNNYEAIVVAKVITIAQSENNKILEVEVENSFKKINSKNLEIQEDVTWGMSELGKTYLFFLNEENGTLVNPLCSPTTLYEGSVINEPILQGKEIPLINTIEKKSNVNGLLSDLENNPLKALAVTSLILLVASSLIIHNTLKVHKNRKKE